MFIKWLPRDSITMNFRSAFNFSIENCLKETVPSFAQFQNLEDQISDMEPTRRVGPIMFLTDPLKLSLLVECKNWKHCYGRHLNTYCSREMDELHKYFTIMQKRLNHPLIDLDDVRAHKTAMADIRDAEIRIDMTIMPIEEACVMLNKYKMFFNDGNAERIDSISYAWKLLKQQVGKRF